MAKDTRQLRDDAASAAAAGKYKRALEYYTELEKAEPTVAQWPKRGAEMWRKLGKNKEAVQAYERAVASYASGGFTAQAVALCKLALQIDPTHTGLQTRLQTLAPEPARANTFGVMTDVSAPAFAGPTTSPAAETPRAVRASEPSAAPRKRPLSEELGIADHKPAARPPSAPHLSLSNALGVAGGPRHEGSGLHVPRVSETRGPVVSRAKSSPESRTHARPLSQPFRRPSELEIAIDEDDVDASLSTDLSIDELDISDELEMGDLEEILEDDGLSANALVALEAAEVLQGLSQAARETLARVVKVASLTAGSIVFQEGEVGDALYVVSEGEVVMRANGPPATELGRYGARTAFGEISLITDQPRPATALAATPCELLTIDRDVLAGLLAEHPEAPAAIGKHIRDQLIERLVRTSALFRPFTETERKELAERFRVIEVEDGVQVLAPGSRPDGLYIVLAGRLNVISGNAPIQLGAGDLLGEVSLLTNEKLPYGVESVGKCLVMQLPRSAFQELIMTHPQLLEYVGEQAEARKRVQMI